MLSPFRLITSFRAKCSVSKNSAPRAPITIERNNSSFCILHSKYFHCKNLVFQYLFSLYGYSHTSDECFLILTNDHNIKAFSLYNTVGSDVEISQDLCVLVLNHPLCTAFIPVFDKFKPYLLHNSQ